VASAQGYPASADVYVVIKQLTPKPKTVGKTPHHKSADQHVVLDQTFKCPCTPDSQFLIQVKGQHTLRDDDLGQAPYFVDESGSGAAKEVKVGAGSVTIRSSFAPAEDQGQDHGQGQGQGLGLGLPQAAESPKFPKLGMKLR